MPVTFLDSQFGLQGQQSQLPQSNRTRSLHSARRRQNWQIWQNAVQAAEQDIMSHPAVEVKLRTWHNFIAFGRTADTHRHTHTHAFTLVNTCLLVCEIKLEAGEFCASLRNNGARALLMVGILYCLCSRRSTSKFRSKLFQNSWHNLQLFSFKIWNSDATHETAEMFNLHQFWFQL